MIGSIPYTDDEVKEPVKLMALKLMNEQFGITEKDFLRAEVEFVPAHKASDVGFDRSMVGAYGQDDRICAYTALMAFPNHLTGSSNGFPSRLYALYQPPSCS